MYSLILLAGGSGTRMNNPVPKQYMLLAGKPVIMHTLERVDAITDIAEIVVVCSAEYRDRIGFMCAQYGITKPVRFAASGQTRQASVLAGLKESTCNDIVIHEAARPFVKREEFEALIAHPEKNVIVAAPINYTVLKGNDQVQGLLNRSELINVQLPQKFEKKQLMEAHLRAEKEGLQFTEDASVVFHYDPNARIKIMKGTDYNIKITTPTDMMIGKIIYDEYFSGRADG